MLRLLRAYVTGQWPGLVALLALLLGSVAISLGQPLLLADFIERATAGHFGAQLGHLAIAYLVLGLLGQAVSVVDVYLAEHLGLVATNRLRRDLTLHCLRLDQGFHGDHRPGELIQRIDGDVTSLANFFSRFSVALLGDGILLVGALVLLATVDWRLGGGLGVLCVVVGVLVVRHRAFGRRHWADAMEAQAEQAGFLEEHLAGTEDLRASGATGHAMWRFTHVSRDLLRRSRRAWFFGGVVGNAAGATFRFGSIGALAGAVVLLRRGDIGLGDVFLVFAYTEMLAHPIQELNRQVGDVQTAAAAVGRVADLLDVHATITSPPSASIRRLPEGPLAVDIDRVTFRYVSDAGPPVLDDVSVRVAPGHVLGVLGRTGSGKSTLVKALVRFLDVADGHVSLGGVDVRNVALDDLRSRVALVTQEVELFHASARDNLTLFDPTVADDRVVAALGALGLGPWLEGLPDGLDTELSAGATGLSAGEAQLLAFARVFLRDPSVVILDEATARLDPATERRVENAIGRLLDGRTGIVIAHRLQTLRHVDQILVLDHGRVAEHGDRAALAADPRSRYAGLLRVGLDDEVTA